MFCIAVSIYSYHATRCTLQSQCRKSYTDCLWGGEVLQSIYLQGRTIFNATLSKLQAWWCKVNGCLSVMRHNLEKERFKCQMF